MTGLLFVDSNVVVYRYDASEPEKQRRADDWLKMLWKRRSGRLSFQVLQECYVTLTRKLKPAMATADAQRVVRALAAWRPVPVDLPILERAWLLQGRFSHFLVGRAHRRVGAGGRVRGVADGGSATWSGVRHDSGRRSFRIPRPDAAAGPGHPVVIDL